MTKTDLHGKIDKLKAKLSSTHHQLRKISNEVVKPLLSEVKIKDLLNERLLT